MHDGPCADFYVVSHANAAHQDGPGADPAVLPDHRGLPVDLADGDVLVDPAAGSQGGVAGDEHAVQPVGQGRDPQNHGVGAYIAAVAVGGAVGKVRENVPPEPRPRPLR